MNEPFAKRYRAAYKKTYDPTALVARVKDLLAKHLRISAAQKCGRAAFQRAVRCA